MSVPQDAWLSTVEFSDHEGSAVASQPALGRLERGCRLALGQHIERSRRDEGPFAQADGDATAQLKVERVAEGSGKVSIAYLIMGHRGFAHMTISRLIRVLWHPTHLFLIHLDKRTKATAVDDMRTRYATYPNVHVMADARRRSIGWGAFSMVDLLLHAIATALAANPHLDFFINLSDADVALRTNREVVGFLSGFKGHSFVATKFPQADAMRYHAHMHMRRSSWLECDGEGFLIVNQTAGSFFGDEGRRCCYARSGPIIYASAQLPVSRPAPPEGWGFYHGSQWLVLARNAAEWLVRDPAPSALARHMRLTYMADETYVQTALQHSPFRESIVNHNLRYIDWPHGYGDPNAYWASMGGRHISGPMVLTDALFMRAVGSPALFARKIDLDHSGGVNFAHLWDRWMGAKLAAEGGDAGGGAAGDAAAEAAQRAEEARALLAACRSRRSRRASSPRIRRCAPSARRRASKGCWLGRRRGGRPVWAGAARTLWA